MTSTVRPIAAIAAIAASAAVCAFGALSVLLGQDATWDFRNYHRYDAWALVDGRLATDLAPAGMPTYFNPLLDLPHFLLAAWWPPRLLAFAMGAWHGVAVLATYAIARAVLPGERDRAKAAMLAVAGCLAPAFLAELGTTMGDDTTAPLLLASLALVVRADAGSRPTRFGIAGVVAGAAIGLKLTNAPYGVALALATALVPAADDEPRFARFARGATLAFGVALGIAATYGWWAATLWHHFGNPLFPQFNALFGAPLAAHTGVVDDKWFASTAGEALLFPWVFTLFPMRVHEIPLANPLWPAVYTLFVAWVVVRVVRAVRGEREQERIDGHEPAAAFLLAFAAIAYACWLVVFSIGRYLIALELLLPLLAWMLLARLFRPRVARTLVGVVFAIAVAVPLGRLETWGHAPFGEAALRVEVPAIDDAARATVLVLTAPVAWTLPAFPRELAFVARNGSFPESPAYRARVRATIASRGGPLYALLPGDADEAGSGLTCMNAFLAAHDVRDGDLFCDYVRAALDHAPASDVTTDRAARGACRFVRDPARLRLSSRDAEAIAHAIGKDGLHVELATCPTFRAWIGARPFDYRFCRVTIEAERRVQPG